MAKVFSNLQANRVLFEGPDDAAQEFVENNFPRVHVDAAVVVENPQPDVHVVLDKGGKVQFNGEEWVSVNAPAPTAGKDK